MQKREAAFQVRFNRWLKYVYIPNQDNTRPFTAVFELKHDRKRGSIPFSEVQDHQLLSLSAAATEGVIFKIPDDSLSYKPFDCFATARVPAYVVPCYGSRFYLIRVDRWIAEADSSERRSLTEEAAKQIAECSGELGSKVINIKSKLS